MRFQNLPNRSDLSTSGLMSGFTERDNEPVGGGEYAPPQGGPSYHRPTHVTQKSRHTQLGGPEEDQSYDQVVMFKSDGFDNSHLQPQVSAHH